MIVGDAFPWSASRMSSASNQVLGPSESKVDGLVIGVVPGGSRSQVDWVALDSQSCLIGLEWDDEGSAQSGQLSESVSRASIMKRKLFRREE